MLDETKLPPAFSKNLLYLWYCNLNISKLFFKIGFSNGIFLTSA